MHYGLYILFIIHDIKCTQIIVFQQIILKNHKINRYDIKCKTHEENKCKHKKTKIKVQGTCL